MPLAFHLAVYRAGDTPTLGLENPLPPAPLKIDASLHSPASGWKSSQCFGFESQAGESSSAEGTADKIFADDRSSEWGLGARSEVRTATYSAVPPEIGQRVHGITGHDAGHLRRNHLDYAGDLMPRHGGEPFPLVPSRVGGQPGEFCGCDGHGVDTDRCVPDSRGRLRRVFANELLGSAPCVHADCLYVSSPVACGRITP